MRLCFHHVSDEIFTEDPWDFLGLVHLEQSWLGLIPFFFFVLKNWKVEICWKLQTFKIIQKILPSLWNAASPSRISLWSLNLGSVLLFGWMHLCFSPLLFPFISFHLISSLGVSLRMHFDLPRGDIPPSLTLPLPLPGFAYFISIYFALNNNNKKNQGREKCNCSDLPQCAMIWPFWLWRWPPLLERQWVRALCFYFILIARVVVGILGWAPIFMWIHEVNLRRRTKLSVEG